MRVRVVVASASLAVVFGCAPPSAKDVAQETAAEVTSFARGALSAANSVNGLEAVTMMTKGYSVAVTGKATGATVPTTPQAATYDSQLNEVSKFLTDRIFTEANVESTEGSATIFRLMGDDLCTTNGSAQSNAQCIDYVTRMELRIKVSSPGSGAYDLTFLIGPNKVAPLVFRIRKDKSLALEADLAQGKAAAAHISSVIGQTVELPQVLEGVVQVMLEKTGAHAYKLSESVLSAVRVEMDRGGDTYKFSTAVATPLTSFGVDGDAKRITIGLGLGETEFTMPYTTSCSACTSAQKAPVTIHLGGASYAFDVTAGQTDFTITNLGLGDVTTWSSYNGTHILDADLNAASGRRFALNLKADTDGLPIISLSPQLDLSVKVLFSALAPAGYTVAPWLVDETYTLTAHDSPSFKLVERAGQSSGALKLIHGSLSLGTSKAGVQPVAVSAGQCVIGNSTLAPGAHELLGLFSAISCP